MIGATLRPFAFATASGRFGAILRIRRSPVYRLVSANSGPSRHPRNPGFGPPNIAVRRPERGMAEKGYLPSSTRAANTPKAHFIYSRIYSRRATCLSTHRGPFQTRQFCEQDYPSGRPALRNPARKRSRSLAQANGRLRRSSSMVRVGMRRDNSSNAARAGPTLPRCPLAEARTA
jgi:hypothetical protein